MSPLIALLCMSFAEPSLDLATLPRVQEVRDTLHRDDELKADARACLDGLCWQPSSFQVETSRASGPHDVWVTFPTPHPTGHSKNDVVVIEGSLAKDKSGQPKKARAVVVVHESGSGMTVGKLFASGLRDRGLHSFMVQMPYYGLRRGDQKRPTGPQVSSVMRQAVADVRRTRDAIAALPWVESDHIGLQGTSLGGFIVANVGAVDHGYDSVFILLAGGDLYGMMQTGKREVAQFRRELSEAGIEGEKLKQLLQVVEPTRIAHRLRPDRTWLYSALADQVVPFENGLVLASAAKLDKQHHISLIADHYTGVIYLPLVLDHIKRNMER